MDDDQEDFVEDEDDTEEEWNGMETYRPLPTGLTVTSVVWNVLTFTSDVVLAFDKLVRNFRADLEFRDATKVAEREFTSSVEAGIESLG